MTSSGCSMKALPKKRNGTNRIGDRTTQNLLSGTDMTGEVPCRTSLVPLAFPCFVLCLIGVETEGLLDYQGRAGDHFHCTVEPSPGHIRCRFSGDRICFIFSGFEDLQLYEAWKFRICSESVSSREKLYTPPPSPHFLAKRHFSREGGGGVYFEAPRGRNFIRPPFYTPPTPRRVFSEMGGVGVYKIWPRISFVFPDLFRISLRKCLAVLGAPPP